MKTYKHFLIFALLICTSFAHAAFDYQCIGKDKPLPPEPRTYTDDNGDTHDTDAFKSWKDSYGANKQNWSCCNKLVLNATTRVCEDPSMTDSSLQECSSASECSDGKGCYERSDDDLFNAENATPAEEEAAAEKEKKFEEQQNSLGENGGDKGPGAACYRNMECESYQCKNFKCEAPPKICRIAEAGDYAPGGIKCEEPLQKSQTTSICGGDVDYYSGLLGDIVVGQKVGGTSCEYQLYPTGKDSAGNALGGDQIEGAINLAIRTLRSMEWLYSTVSNDDHKDCLYTRFYMKSKMEKLINQRKDILKAYNEDMLFIEDNFRAISAAQLENKSQIATLCSDAGGGYEMTTQHDVASRKASGLDFLCYMKERNILYKEYELAMNTWAAELQTYTTSYRDTVFTWGEKDKNWTTGDKSYSYKDRGCRNWTDWHKKVKRRWSERYKVKGSHGVNAVAVNMPGVSQYLKFLSDDNAPRSFNSGTYYLIDPLMPGGWHQGVSFENFGASRNLNGKYDRSLGGGLGGAFNSLMAGSVGAALLGPVGFGIAIGTGGGNGSGLANIYDKFDPRLVAYVQSLRKDLEPANFIYEPEIRGSYEMRGCMDKIDAPECLRFKQYLSDIKNFAFAQMLAHSRHYKKKYKSYFKEEGTWRRKLFARYDVDLVNLQKYYNALSGPNGLRTKQNECLDKLINGVHGDFGTTEGTGVTTGLSNYYNQTSTNYAGADGDGKNYNKPKVKGSLGSPKSFKLSALNFAFKGNGSLKDGVSGNNGAGSGAVGGAIVGDGALAARMKAMEVANSKAAAKGVDLNAKSKELQDNMAQAHLLPGGAGSMAGRGSSSGAASGASSGSGSGYKATLGAGEMAKENADKNAGKGKGIASGAAGGVNAGAVSGIVGGASSGSASGSDSGAGSSANQGDASGMSDEEKDRMAANYDRTKGEYKTKEDDSLFQVLSKTYVRNLDKILTRKKKLDEDAASFPSEPSKP